MVDSKTIKVSEVKRKWQHRQRAGADHLWSWNTTAGTPVEKS
jgi:hypothetical protein